MHDREDDQRQQPEGSIYISSIGNIVISNELWEDDQRQQPEVHDSDGDGGGCKFRSH